MSSGMKVLEKLLDGLDSAPGALIGLLAGASVHAHARWELDPIPNEAPFMRLTSTTVKLEE